MVSTLENATGLLEEQRTGESCALTPTLVDRPAQPSLVASLPVTIAVTCAILRQVVRNSWLDPAALEGMRGLSRLISELHAQAGGFALVVDNDAFRHEESGQRLQLSGKAVVQLHRFFQRRGLTAVRFAANVPPLALKNLLRGLIDPDYDMNKTLRPDSGIELQYAAAGTTPAIVILRDGSEDAGAILEPPYPVARASPTVAVDPAGQAALPPPCPASGQLDRQIQVIRRENAAIREACRGIVTAGGEGPELAILTSLDAMERDEHIMYLLASLRQHDRYTFDHSCNVTLLAVAIARSMGFRGQELVRFASAALLHDIGKLYTPLTVLNKPGKFTPEEWRAMRRHPADGMEILTGAGVENTYSEQVTLLHHVSLEGGGYPTNTREKPNIFAQLVQVADIYDAFTTIRPYRQQQRPREVLQVLKQGAGKRFNQAVVDATVELMGETPLGSVLKLDNGQLGLVVDITGGVESRPIVRVIQDEFGNRPDRIVVLDLSARIPATGAYLVDAVETVDPVIRNIQIGRYI